MAGTEFYAAKFLRLRLGTGIGGQMPIQFSTGVAFVFGRVWLDFGIRSFAGMTSNSSMTGYITIFRDYIFHHILRFTLFLQRKRHIIPDPLPIPIQIQAKSLPITGQYRKMNKSFFSPQV